MTSYEDITLRKESRAHSDLTLAHSKTTLTLSHTDPATERRRNTNARLTIAVNDVEARADGRLITFLAAEELERAISCLLF